MVDGRSRVARLLRVWVPLGFFLVLALFPFYWMAITSLKPNAELYNTRMMPRVIVKSCVWRLTRRLAPLGAHP
jgi:multiple sugar transport system permease protein